MRFFIVFPLIWWVLWMAGCSRYDLDRPDTEANRKGFVRHLGVSPGDQIRNVWYYADELGADPRYQLAFTCDPGFVRRLVEALELEPPSDRWDGLRPRTDLPGWSTWSGEKLDHWVFTGGSVEIRELWYHPESGQAYYMEYRL